MRLGLGLNITANSRRGGTPAFSPSTLFSTTAIGIWLDPSDLSTMFSDRAGTTPVTTPGTVVGLRLDKSKGLALGAELVTNGDFSSGTTGWSAAGNAGISAVGGRLRIERTDTTNFPRALFNITGLTAGKSYLVTGQTFSNGISCKIDVPGANAVPFSAADRNLSFYFHNGGTTITVEVVFNGGAGAIGAFIEADNISVRELPGNHAVAPTDAARPTYGVEPKGGRRNLLTWSEGFDNAVWAKPGVTVTQSAGAEWAFTPTVTNNTKNVTQSVVAGSTAAISIEAKPSGYTKLVLQIATGITAIFDLSAITATVTGGTGTASIVASGDGYYRCTTVPTAVTAGTRNFDMFVANASNATSFAGDGTSAILVRRPQVELGSTATAYQRVTTAYDVTESGVATTHYVQYDGSDDSMSTAAIDFTATDKMSVFAGVRKLSDAGFGVVAELGAGQNTAGSFGVGVGTANGDASRRTWSMSHEGSSLEVVAAAAVYPSPDSRVQTSLFDRSQATQASELQMRLNGSAQTLVFNNSSLSSGNYGTYPLFVGRRNNASLSFSGKDYGLIVVGKAASAGEITDTETWLAAKTSGVTI